MTTLLVVAAAGLLAATALSFLRDWRWTLLSNFRLHLGVASLAVALLLWLADGATKSAIVLIVLLLLVAALNLGVILWATRQNQRGRGGEARLRLVFANLLEHNRAYYRLIDWVREERPDVLIVAEAGVTWKLALAALEDEFPFVAGSRLGDVAIYSRHPFAGEAIDLFAGLGGHAVSVQLGGLSLVGVHTASPETRARSVLLDQLIDQIADHVRGLSGPVLAVGDFNAVPWSRAVRRLTAATSLGFGPGAASGTFPAVMLGWNIPAWIALPIDLVLTGGEARLLRRSRGPRVGSDHWPVVVEVSFPSPQSGRESSTPI